MEYATNLEKKLDDFCGIAVNASFASAFALMMTAGISESNHYLTAAKIASVVSVPAALARYVIYLRRK